MKQLRILSDGTAGGTSFELFDERGVQEVAIPAASIRWEIKAHDTAKLTVEFELVSLNIYHEAEHLVPMIDAQIQQLLNLRNSITR